LQVELASSYSVHGVNRAVSEIFLANQEPKTNPNQAGLGISWKRNFLPIEIFDKLFEIREAGGWPLKSLRRF
jgi:hypothetical protein